MRLIHSAARSAIAAVLLPASALLAGTTRPAARGMSGTGSTVTRVTANDVAYFDQKAAAADAALVDMWTD